MKAVLRTMAAGLCFLALAPAYALRWDFSPKVEFSETYTDNLRLVPEHPVQPGQVKQDDYITQFNPTLFLNGKGNRFAWQSLARMQNVYYQNGATERNPETFCQGSVRSHVDVIRKQLSIPFTLNYEQTQLDANYTAEDNYHPIGDRTDTLTMAIGPQYQYRFANSMGFNAGVDYERLAFLETRYRTTMIGANTAVDSGRIWANVVGSLHYLYQVKYFPENNTSNTLARIYGEAEWTGRWIKTDVQLGYEDVNYDHTGKDLAPDGPYGFLGFKFAPNAYTRYDIGAGHKFIGYYYLASFEQRLRFFRWNVNYRVDDSAITEEIGSRATDILGPADPTLPAGPVTAVDTLNSQLTQRSYIEKLASIGFNIGQRRMEFGVNVFDEERDFKSLNADAAEAGLQKKEFYRGGEASLTFRPGLRTAVKLSYLKQKNDITSLLGTVTTARTQFSVERRVRQNIGFNFIVKNTAKGDPKTQADTAYEELSAALQFDMLF